MDALSVAALVIAVISAGIAIWQGVTSKMQLELAKQTESRTNAALDEIRRVTNETRQITQDVKSNIDDRITRILDTKLETEQKSAATGEAFGQMFMQKLMDSMGSPEETPPTA